MGRFTRFRIHLGTALILMLTASLLIYKSIEQFTMRKLNGDVVSMARYGWPFEWVNTSSDGPTVFASDFSSSLFTPRITGGSLLVGMADAGIALGLLLVAALICEWAIRRHRVHAVTLLLVYVATAVFIWGQYRTYKLVGEGSDPLNPPTAWGWPMTLCRFEWIEVQGIMQQSVAWLPIGVVVDAVCLVVTNVALAYGLERLLRRRSTGSAQTAPQGAAGG
jgi:hypothetical protein